MTSESEIDTSSEAFETSSDFSDGMGGRLCSCCFFARVAMEKVPERVWEEGPEEVECVICLIELKAGDSVRSLPCCHHFHSPCLEDWFRKSTNFSCPTCRARILSIEPFLSSDISLTEFEESSEILYSDTF